MSNSPIAATPTGVRLRVHIQPRASRTELAGLYGNALKVRVAAPPVEGAANEALIRFLSERLDVPRAALRLEAGARGRAKVLTVDGIGLVDASRRLGLRAPGASERLGSEPMAPRGVKG